MTKALEKELQKLNAQLRRIDQNLKTAIENMHILYLEISRVKEQYKDIIKRSGYIPDDNCNLGDTSDAVVADWLLKMSF